MTNRPSIAAALLALLAAACGGQLPQEPSDYRNAEENLEPAQAPLLQGTRRHLMPLRGAATRGSAAVAGPHLEYYGGHVVSNAKMVAVFWGSTVDATLQGQIGNFYAGITSSSYFDWLSEYDTSINAIGGQPGTGQHIGRGSFVGSYTITPSVAGNVTDAQIETELAAQIAAGSLPVNDENTIYMINFPAGVAIDSGGALSCQAFCAYHSTMQISGASVYYAVLPDLSQSGCDVGCGVPGDTFNNTTEAASHELIETVTDAEVGLAQSFGPPLAWYDSSTDQNGNQRGEIGDICNGIRGAAVGPDGTSWVVQKEWSNHAGDCVDVLTAPQPPTVGITNPIEGASVTGTVLITASATGSSFASIVSIDLFLDNAPLGSSNADNLTIDWDTSRYAAGAHTITAYATDSNGLIGYAGAVHVSTVNAVPPADYIKNGDFTGTLKSWTTGGKTPIVSVVRAHGGKNSMRLGATPAVKPDGDSFAYQLVTIPAGARSATLTFWSWSVIASASADFVEADVRDASGKVVTAAFHAADNSQAWKQTTVDLSAMAGQTIQVYFNAHGTKASPATMWVDDVHLLVN